MREIPVFKDTRLLEALDYIDRDLIAEVVNDIKAPDSDEIPGQNKKAVWRSVKHTLLFAACLVLLGAVIPVVTYVSQNLDIISGGIWGHSTSEATESQDNNTEQASNAHYPMFTPDLEPISDDTVAELKAVWYKMVYDAEYEAYSKIYADFQGSEEDKAKFSARAAETIATVYTELLFSPNRKDHFRGRYYGTIGNCVIFAINTYLEDEYNFITLGKTTIQNDYSFYIFAYKDGVIKTAAEAYSDGWLNTNDAEKIKERHNKFNNYGYWIDEKPVYKYTKFVSDLEEITDKEIDEINEVLFKEEYDAQFSKYEDTFIIMYDSAREIRERCALNAYQSAENVNTAFIKKEEDTDKTWEEYFRYYGKFRGRIIWATVEINTVSHGTLYGVHGIKLNFDSTAKVYVFDNGKVYDLADYYYQGLLTVDDALKLYGRYLAYEDYLSSHETEHTSYFPRNKEEDEIYSEVVKGDWVIFNGGNLIAGKELWLDFYENYLKEDPAAVHIANYYPFRDTLFLSTIVYDGEQIQQVTEGRQGGMIASVSTGIYDHIIKYEGEPSDKNDTIHDHEETYMLVSNDTSDAGNGKSFLAFSELSYLDDTPVDFNITADQDAILSDIFGNTYDFAEGKWNNYIDIILTAKEAEIWNREAPSDIFSILDFLKSNSRFQRIWLKLPSPSSDRKSAYIAITPEQDAIITELVDEKYKCYAGYWDIWFYKMLHSGAIVDWNESGLTSESAIKQFMDEYHIKTYITANVPLYP